MQRFPMTVLSKSYRGWADHTSSVESPGEGLKGGVFILKDTTANNAPLEKVVVKPLHDEGGAQSQFGDAMVQQVGIRVPSSRFVPRQANEYTAIADQIRTTWNQKRQASILAAQGLGALQGPLPELDDSLGIKVMGAIDEPSLAKRAELAGTDANHLAQLRTILGKASVWQQLGKMMVADAVIGNNDRLSFKGNRPFMNLGNILAPVNGDLWAIDTATVLLAAESVQHIGQKTGRYNANDLEYLAEPAALRLMVEELIVEIGNKIDAAFQGPVPQGGMPGANLVADYAVNLNNFAMALRSGVVSGIQLIGAVLTGDTRQDRRARGTLKDQARGDRSWGQSAKADAASWRTMKGRWAAFEAYRGHAASGTRGVQGGAVTNPNAAAKAAEESAAAQYIISKAAKDADVHERITRVLTFGMTEGILTNTQALKVVTRLADVKAGEQKKLVHIWTKAQKNATGAQGVTRRLEAARAVLLGQLAADVSVAQVKTNAKELLDAGVGDVNLSEGARYRLQAIGVPQPFIA